MMAGECDPEGFEAQKNETQKAHNGEGRQNADEFKAQETEPGTLEAARTLLKLKDDESEHPEILAPHALSKLRADKFERPGLGKTFMGTDLPKLPPQFASEVTQFMQNSGEPYQKQLTKTDINRSLTIPIKFAKLSVFKLLTSDEYKALRDGNPMAVTIFSNDGNPSLMQLKYTRGESKVTIAGGLEFLKDSKGEDLRKHVHWLNSWPFRHSATGKICFVFTVSQYSTPQEVPKKSEKARKGRTKM